MTKLRLAYICQHCGAGAPKWAGQCANCFTWNSLLEEVPTTSNTRYQGFATGKAAITPMADIVFSNDDARLNTGSSELNRVLGGGLVMGSVVLTGGDPGIGKSTLLLQTLCHLSQNNKVLYVTGEESLQQVTLRARRLDLPEKNLFLLADTSIERILQLTQKEKPQILVIDSIQTMHTEFISAAPGSVSQVRESAAQLVQFAKQTQTALFLVGHVTKEGSLAGPRVLEHMVDTVLYFESAADSRYRLIRATKNRFGAVNELGIFAMTEKGLREINQPSAIFLSRYEKPVSGSVMTSICETNRPLLIEIQALVDQNQSNPPRRVSLGLDAQRLTMLLAILHRHSGVTTHDQDVFINAVGGMRINETGTDLAILFAILSSLRNQPIPSDLIIFGEIGLAGEIRPVQSGQARLRESVKHGFRRAIIPDANAPREKISQLEIFPISSVSEGVGLIKNF